MCVVKLHDEVVDVRSLDDSAFYLVSIGKGVSPSSLSSHTVFIDADFARVDEHLRRSQEVAEEQERQHGERQNERHSERYTGQPSDQLLTEEGNALGGPQLSAAQEERPSEANQSASVSKPPPAELFQGEAAHPDKQEQFPPHQREKKKQNNRHPQANMIQKSKMNHIDAFFNLHVFKKKRTFFKSPFFHFDAHNGMFFKSNKKLRNVEDLADTVCLCVWDLCSILTNEEKLFLKGKMPVGASDVGPNSLGENGATISGGNNSSGNCGNGGHCNSHAYGRNEVTHRGGAKKLESRTVLHPTLVCIIGNLPESKMQANKRKSNESGNSITTFCTWLSSRNQLYKVVKDPLEGEEHRLGKSDRREHPSRGNHQLSATLETPKKKGLFWHLFNHKVCSNNFSQDAYVFYGDQLGYIHVVHLQIYKEVHFFRAFDVPILKVFVCRNLVTKLLVLADARLRIYRVESALEITLIKEVQIKHDVPPSKCICEAKINELKEKEKKGDNENDGVSIFNLSYFLSSNYPKKQSNPGGDDKLSGGGVSGGNGANVGSVCTEHANASGVGGGLGNGSTASAAANLAGGGSTSGVGGIAANASNSFSGKNNPPPLGNHSSAPNDSPQNPTLAEAKSGSFTPLPSEEKGKEKPTTTTLKESSSTTPPKGRKNSTSSNSLCPFKTISDSEDEADANSDKDAYQSVIIGGINFGYLGFNFSKFMINKKKTIIVDAYMLSNSHLVTVSSNGTLTLIKV